jgi:hypothetical protein
MARIRSVKPGYFTSLDTAGQLSRDCRLHFIGLWTYADDEGRGIDDFRLLKAALWPLDEDVSTGVVEAWQIELEQAGRLVRYTVGGRPYFQIVGWHDHQHPNRKQESTHPAPTAHEPHSEPTVNTHGADTDRSLPEGRGEESRGEEKEKERSVPRKRGQQLPDGWTPDDVTRAKLARDFPQIDLGLELDKFRDHAADKGRTAKDWTAAFRNWIRNAETFRRQRHPPPEQRHRVSAFPDGTAEF